MEARKFKNDSPEDFSWKYDGVPFNFPAGSEMYLEDYKAEHFAHHWVDREIGRMNIDKGFLGDKAKEISTRSVQLRAELMTRCLPTNDSVTPAAAFDLNEKAKRAPKEKPAEFEDLNLKPRKRL